MVTFEAFASSGGHRRLRAAASDEEADEFLPDASMPSQSLERQVRSVRLMSAASVLLGIVSVVIMVSVLLSPGGAGQPVPSQASVVGLDALPAAEVSGRGWYRLYLDSQVWECEDLDSEKVRTLYAGSLVYVAETQGRRVRILRPVAGWMPTQTADGIVILRPDLTYEAGPKQEDIQAVFQSRRVREANERLQESAMRLTKVEHQVLEALKKMKDLPEHVQKKLNEKWPQIAEQAPKTGKHLAKHGVHAFHRIVESDGMQKLADHAAQNEHIQKAVHGKKLGELFEKAKHDVGQVQRSQQDTAAFEASFRAVPDAIAV